MRSLQVYSLVVLLLVGIGVTPPARASSCESLSPNLQFSGDIWSPIAARPLSQHFQARLFAFLTSLEGNWEGTGSSTACVVSGTDTIPVKAPEQLKLSIKPGAGADYHFEFRVFDTKNNVHTTYAFILKQVGRQLQVVGEGNLAILEFYDGGLKFRTQTAMRTGFRRRFGTGTSNTLLSLETVRQLRLQNGNLEFNKAVFHNGTMIEFSQWMLARN